MAMKKVVKLDKLDGNALKALLEQNTDNGHTDTIPEIIKRLEEIPEDTSFEDYVRQIAQDYQIEPETLMGIIETALQQNTADHSDIDEIFGTVSTAPTVPTQPIAVEEEEEP